MKKMLVVALLLGVSFLAKSQKEDDKSFYFGAGAVFGVPTGDLKESHELGYGLELQASYSVVNNVQVFFQTGASVYKVKSSFGNDANGTLHVPILVGGKCSFGGFHVGAGLGYSIWSASGGGNANGFTYSPQIGYQFDKMDILANYTSSSVTGGTLSYFGVKVLRLF